MTENTGWVQPNDDGSLLSFCWDLWARTVSLPEEKRDRVVQKLRHFLDTLHVSQKECASLHGSLQHICFVCQDALSTLPALLGFLSKFPNDFVLHFLPCSIINDLNLWMSCLLGPSLTCSILLRPCLDPNFHIDASSSFGLGFVIGNQYAGW